MAKKRGDRKDGVWVRDVNADNTMATYIMPKKTESELYIKETFKVRPLLDYVAEKKAQGSNITLFSTFIAALVRTCAEKPTLNRFVKAHRTYQRTVADIGYVASVERNGKNARALHKTAFPLDADVFQVADRMKEEIAGIKTGSIGATGSVIDKFAKYPRFLLVIMYAFIKFLDKHGWVPEKFIGHDPNYSSIFISNMGSLKTGAPFHHLNEWGTNSIFLCMGEIKDILELQDDGTVVKVQVMDLAFTLDERIANGHYFAESIKVLMKYLADPKLLEEPFKDEGADL